MSENKNIKPDKKYVDEREGQQAAQSWRKETSARYHNQKEFYNSKLQGSVINGGQKNKSPMQNKHGKPNRPVERVESNPDGSQNKPTSQPGTSPRQQQLQKQQHQNQESPHKKEEANWIKADLQHIPVGEIKKLKADGIFPLKKRSAKFPKAKFFCRLCDYHCDSLEISRIHSRDSRHMFRKENKMFEKTLNKLPPVVDAQYSALTQLLCELESEHGITKDQIEQRFTLKNDLENKLNDIMPDATIEVIGSTLSGFALKSSSLDLEINVADIDQVAKGLLTLREIIQREKDLYKDILNDLSSVYPCICFTHTESGVRVVVGGTNSTAPNTNKLMAYYNELDCRVKPVVTAFKLWAKLSDISDAQAGALSPHCFPLMAIHYLQQTSPPVLPVLHALHEQEGPEFYLTPSEVDPLWTSKSEKSLGELWIGLFRFYALDFKTSVHVINVRRAEPMVRTESRWGKKMAIEDPFKTRRNMTHTVSCMQMYDYISNRFKNAYRYFTIPQINFGPLFKHILTKPEPLFESNTNDTGNSANEAIDDANSDDDNIANGKLEETEDDAEEERDEEKDNNEGKEESKEQSNGEQDFDEKINNLLTNLQLDASEEERVESMDSEETPPEMADTEPDVPLDLHVKDVSQSLGVIPFKLAKHLMSQLKKDMLLYRFEKRLFTNAEPLPLHCTACQTAGHTKQFCREFELPPLVPLPPISRNYLRILSNIFTSLKHDCAPKPNEIRYRERIVSELQDFISVYFTGAVLTVFGSSVNGFGFGNSDLDVCLMFEGHETGENLNYVDVIEKLAHKLKRFRDCRQVLAITTAKVPIVKFTLRGSLLEGDLSLYNTLALQNTRLLSTYADIDPRVKILGYTMKYFAKLCDIGDASRGSLSSYAYVLMLLHFLQQCHPPVIPVLQELYDKEKARPTLMIDGWNTWFYEDLSTLNEVWPERGRNKQSVGALWIDLLCYFTHVFDWSHNVITIKQKKPLTKLEKMWTTQCLAIEDPFDLTHNLGSGLSRKMNTFIIKSFIKGRALFGSGHENPPPNYINLVEFLFDRQLLTDGVPPNDRGCRWCGRIGHVVKECPRKVQKKEKKVEQREHKSNKNTPPRESDRNDKATDLKETSLPREEKKQNKVTVDRSGSIGSSVNIQSRSSSAKSEDKKMGSSPSEGADSSPSEGTICIDSIPPPIGVFESFLSCEQSYQLILNLGFRFITAEALSHPAFSKVLKLILIRFPSPPQPKSKPLYVIYDKFSRLSPAKYNNLSSVLNKVLYCMDRYFKAVEKGTLNVTGKISTNLKDSANTKEKASGAKVMEPLFSRKYQKRSLEILEFFNNVQSALGGMDIAEPELTPKNLLNKASNVSVKATKKKKKSKSKTSAQFINQNVCKENVQERSNESRPIKAPKKKVAKPVKYKDGDCEACVTGAKNKESLSMKPQRKANEDKGMKVRKDEESSNSIGSQSGSKTNLESGIKGNESRRENKNRIFNQKVKELKKLKKLRKLEAKRGNESNVELNGETKASRDVESSKRKGIKKEEEKVSESKMNDCKQTPITLRCGVINLSIDEQNS